MTKQMQRFVHLQIKKQNNYLGGCHKYGGIPAIAFNFILPVK